MLVSRFTAILITQMAGDSFFIRNAMEPVSIVKKTHEDETITKLASDLRQPSFTGDFNA